ncbi:MAG: hypothetical protein QNJ34_21525 [Xenococcaceae cyanobacterium MO_188.B29]|nr:hypothetical protein [Xenococcaceae cyanobacterium MO_188.B29]
MKSRHHPQTTRINTNILDFSDKELHGIPTVVHPKNLSSSSKCLNLALSLMTNGREY